MLTRIAALGIGVLAMYFFDPVSGERRRARVRDQLRSARREIGDYAADARGRARDMMRRRLRERRPPAPVDIDLTQQR